jgi:hypothetical protein
MKGHTFTHADLPRATQLRIKNKQVGDAELKRLDEALAARTERFKVVAMDGETPLIAEELPERCARHWASDEDGQIDSPVLAQIRAMLTLTPEQRAKVLDAFDMEGELANPFNPPPKAGKKK